MNPKDEIARLIEAAEEAAYRRGWEDACIAIKRAADAVQQSASLATAFEADVVIEPRHAIEPRKTGRPASIAIQVVEDCINASPGKKGVDVVKAA